MPEQSASIAAPDYERYDDEVLRLLVEDLDAAPLGWTHKAIIRNLAYEVQRLRSEAKSLDDAAKAVVNATDLHPQDRLTLHLKQAVKRLWVELGTPPIFGDWTPR